MDQIFYAAALAANQARLPLAKMAVTETRMGVVEDKVIKASSFSCFLVAGRVGCAWPGLIARCAIYIAGWRPKPGGPGNCKRELAWPAHSCPTSFGDLRSAEPLCQRVHLPQGARAVSQLVVKQPAAALQGLSSCPPFTSRSFTF